MFGKLLCLRPIKKDTAKDADTRTRRLADTGTPQRRLADTRLPESPETLVGGGVLGGNKLSFVHVEKKGVMTPLKFICFVFSLLARALFVGGVSCLVEAGAVRSVPLSLMMIYCFDCKLAEKKFDIRIYIYVYIYDSGSQWKSTKC